MGAAIWVPPIGRRHFGAGRFGTRRYCDFLGLGCYCDVFLAADCCANTPVTPGLRPYCDQFFDQIALDRSKVSLRSHYGLSVVVVGCTSHRIVVLVVLVAVQNFGMFKIPYTPVTPNGDFTAIFGDFKFGLVAGDHCVVAFNHGLAVTPKHRSQHFCTTRNANRPTVLRLYSECTATIQRLKEIVCDRS